MQLPARGQDGCGIGDLSLSLPSGLETMGLFRRTASKAKVDALKLVTEANPGVLCTLTPSHFHIIPSPSHSHILIPSPPLPSRCHVLTPQVVLVMRTSHHMMWLTCSSFTFEIFQNLYSPAGSLRPSSPLTKVSPPSPGRNCHDSRQCVGPKRQRQQLFCMCKDPSFCFVHRNEKLLLHLRVGKLANDWLCPPYLVQLIHMCIGA